MMCGKLLPTLERKVNGIVGQLSDFQVKIDAETAEINYTHLNSGEKGVKDMMGQNACGSERLLIELSIRSLLGTETNSAPNMLIMDETLGYLDVNKRNNVQDLFQAVKKNFEMVLVISHDAQIRDNVKIIKAKEGVDWDKLLKSAPGARKQ
jgi:DNA repair exonuclease SbcCD ATPase subunit